MSSAAKKKKRRQPARSPLRVVFTLLALVLAAVLLLAAVLVIAPLTERADRSSVDGSADWMGRLDDETPLNELILPGTHSSAAQYTPRAFFTKCQALDIGGQLEAGFRCLDLRLGAGEKSSTLSLLCGDAFCKTALLGDTLLLEDVLRPCYAFLEAHPTEVILLLVQPDEALSVRDFQLTLDAYVRENPQHWLLTDAIPTLGEARGKLVLLRRCADEAGLREAAGIWMQWRDQGGYEDTSLSASAEANGDDLLYVQDRYEYPVEEKWTAFLNGRRGTEEGAVSLNFLSTRGDTAYGHPYEYAKELNARLIEADDRELGGWILVDFGSATLAERIYRLNF